MTLKSIVSVIPRAAQTGSLMQPARRGMGRVMGSGAASNWDSWVLFMVTAGSCSSPTPPKDGCWMQRTVAVVGGGISGLTACYQLARSPNAPKIILLEGSGRLGGWLHSTRTEDGAVFEHGPRGIRPAGSVGKNTLLMGNPSVCVGSGVLRTVPPFTRPLLWSGLHELAAPRGTQLDETIHSFVSRRFGKELADIAIDSLCRGVFAGDCRALSVRSCFPALFEAERRRRSVILGMALGGGKGPALDSALSRRARDERWSQWSLRGGMETLPEALQDFLRRHGVEMHCHARLQRLERTAAECWQITLEDGSVRADHVISAIPARALAVLLPSWAEPLAQELRGIEAVSVGVVNLQYNGATLPITGFGHLVPSFEDRSLLGIVYDSVAFPEQNGTGGPSVRLTGRLLGPQLRSCSPPEWLFYYLQVMLGGAWFEEGFGDPEMMPEARLLSRAKEAVRAHLGLAAEPSCTIVKVLKACIPQYTLGHWQRTETISRYLEREGLPLSLIGASYQGVSVNDCIYNAKMAVTRLLDQAQ
ncbi:Protoporphyrinogen oxidase [Chelonia mydas]|uniref:Protoporphyrinogen oxidase n=1 Tax=Chelonia mydas TaxID=8469 RepID=M7ATE1_CHEMY|nr:Protoporphyrinogen oxidase [Chelonia mydas]